MQLIFKDAASPIQSTSCKEIILRNDAGNGKTEIEKGAPMLFGALSLYTFIHHSFTQESRAWCMLSMSLTPARPPHPPIDCMRRVHDLSVLLLPRCSRSHDQNNAVCDLSQPSLARSPGKIECVPSCSKVVHFSALSRNYWSRCIFRSPSLTECAFICVNVARYSRAAQPAGEHSREECSIILTKFFAPRWRWQNIK